ncbi:hypothetical protein RJT34_12110 [Clitoria ternatea]|uniref:Phosphoribosyltransferase domain-containing protein n=1 Tax=Clitoria ternatea TaxID=43366 RepID=A0AAN9PKM8_CLITE
MSTLLHSASTCSYSSSSFSHITTTLILSPYFSLRNGVVYQRKIKKVITALKLKNGRPNTSLELGKIKMKDLFDGEICVQLQESVRRADKNTQGHESIATKLVANLITKTSENHVLACDHMYGQSFILDYVASKTICSDDIVVVSPDVVGLLEHMLFPKKFDTSLAIVDKRRQGHNVVEVMNLIGDVKGKVAVMVDDMIDTASTIAKDTYELGPSSPLSMTLLNWVLKNHLGKPWNL